MSKIKIEYPDGSKEQVEKGITGQELADKIGERLGQAALAIELNGKIKDLNTKINHDSKIRIITFKDKEGKEIFWHSASHLMTQAVLRVFKGQNIGLGVGVAVEDGFYQDYGMKKPLKPEDLEKIEAEMKKIVKENLEIKQRTIPKKEALEFYKKDPYKIDLTNAVPGNTVSMYSQGEFDNLCKGPHVNNTGKIKAFKLMKIAGAYWRGDSSKDQLQRIYGVAFPDKKELKDYLKLLEEAEKRDHRILGKQLDLFSMHDEAPGMPFFHNKGMIMINILKDYWREVHTEDGYEETQTPMILNKELWVRSGHWENYRENMYLTKIDDIDFAVKPMNCPGGMLIYKETTKSYRDLPLKMGEMGLVHRHELSGVLAGLFRVRCFTQDDAHIFMTEDQIKDQIIGAINLTDKIYKQFGFEYMLELSTRPEKSIGTAKQWETATNGLKSALDQLKKDYKINEGDGAFYGPKIDFHLKDTLGRTWQCGTIQLDMAMPERFDLTYEGKDGKKHRPVTIHRTILGSIERFFGILIEHFAGNFPLWISPVQARIITVADRFMKYGKKVKKELEQAGLRVEIDERTESVSKKVRDAQIEHIPLIINVGEKEEKAGTIAVRTLDGKVKFGIKTADLIKKVNDNVEKREIKFSL